jgi:hypothetical protein
LARKTAAVLARLRLREGGGAPSAAVEAAAVASWWGGARALPLSSASNVAHEAVRTLDLLHGNDTYNLKRCSFAGSFPTAS